MLDPEIISEASDPGLGRTLLVVTGLGGVALDGTPLGTLTRESSAPADFTGAEHESLLARLLVPLLVLVPEKVPADVRAQLAPQLELVSHLQLLPAFRPLTGDATGTVQLGPWNQRVGWLPARAGDSTTWLDPASGALRTTANTDQPGVGGGSLDWRW